MSGNESQTLVFFKGPLGHSKMHQNLGTTDIKCEIRESDLIKKYGGDWGLKVQKTEPQIVFNNIFAAKNQEVLINL